MSDKSSPLLGQVVAGKYRMLEILGEGGMGVVYLAEHQLIEKRVALKVMRREYSSKPELVTRFQQEAISASRIKHPNVLDVFDFGQLEDGSFFLAMEYLQGHDLATELSEQQTLDPVRVVRLGLQTTRALAAAHARGVVHRDMKPENVFLHRTDEGDEVVKIVDFGIAQLKGRDDGAGGEGRRRRLTRTGMIFGTPEYMSPEQAAGRHADLRVDVYSVGIMLYEMLTGAVPFTGDTFMAVLSAHLTQPVPPLRAFAPDLEISAELEALILRALDKDSDRRFPSMREMAVALQATPEGRLAAPLSGLLPIPDVTASSFRPARSAASATSPQIGGAPKVPSFDEDVIARRNAVTQVAGSQRPSTVDGSAMTPTPPVVRPRSRGLTLALIFAVIAVAGAFGWSLWRPDSDRVVAREPVVAAPPRTGISVPSTTPSSVAPTVVPVPSTTASAPDRSDASSSEPEAVTLNVETKPSGAVVLKNGFQICDSTPCTLTAAPDDALVLTAVKGHLRGVARVLAAQDQTVTIVLLPPPRPKKPSKPKLCEVVVDGLKILRPCP